MDLERYRMRMEFLLQDKETTDACKLAQATELFYRMNYDAVEEMARLQGRLSFEDEVVLVTITRDELVERGIKALEDD